MTLSLATDRPCRLQLASSGPHRFGGPAAHRGVTPVSTGTPLNLLLTLDLTDPLCPFRSDVGLRWLPLYYPLRYGSGGPAVQYEIRSDDEIEILYMSDAQPDPPDEAYFLAPELPATPARIVPLTYEEARIRAMRMGCGHFQSNDEDSAVLDRLYRDHDLIEIGGDWRLPVNAGSIICQNPACEFLGRSVWTTLIASIPPVAVGGSDEFWFQFQDGDMAFYFVLCNYCRTMIGFNIAS